MFFALNPAEVSETLAECWYQSATSAGEANDRSPIRAISRSAAPERRAAAMSRLRVSMTMHPAVLYHMGVSFSQPHADLLLSIEAERHASGAGKSGSEARADAVPRRLDALVRCYGVPRELLCLASPDQHLDPHHQPPIDFKWREARPHLLPYRLATLRPAAPDTPGSDCPRASSIGPSSRRTTRNGARGSPASRLISRKTGQREEPFETLRIRERKHQVQDLPLVRQILARMSREDTQHRRSLGGSDDAHGGTTVAGRAPAELVQALGGIGEEHEPS